MKHARGWLLCLVMGLLAMQSGWADTWKTYTDPTGFSFQYPDTCSLYGLQDMHLHLHEGDIPACDVDHMLACVQYPSERYPATNFGGAGVGFYSVPSANRQPSCEPMEQGWEKLDNVMIHGVSMEVYQSRSVALGHQVLDELYRTPHAGACTEIVMRMMKDDVGAGTKTPVVFTEQDEETVHDLLRKIVATFQFTN